MSGRIRFRAHDPPEAAMPLLATKITCPLCGARQPAENVRCATCTRPLRQEGGVSERLYREALWSQAIDDKRRRKVKVSPWAVLALAVVGLGLANWFHFRVGPEWAHSPTPWVKGSDWRTYRGVPGARVDLPGTPITSQVATASGTMTAATVWVDGDWVARRDADTRAVGVVNAARASLHAVLVVAGGPAPADPRTAAAETVGALVGGTLTDPVTSEVQDPAVGRQFDVVAGFTGVPDDQAGGTVRAHIVVTTDAAGASVWFVAVTATNGGDDPVLHADLAGDLVPDGTAG